MAVNAKTRRVVLSSSAVLGSVAALAACGTPADTGTAQNAGKSAAPVTFHYWDWAADWQELVTELERTFNTKSGSTANTTIQTEIASDYWTKLQVAIASDTPPDTWRMNGPNLPQWVTMGMMEDVSSYVAKDKEIQAALNAMSPVITDYTKRGGKQWTIPFGQAISGTIAYNADMVKAEGLPLPADLWTVGKWTWAQLTDHAIKLTRRDGSRHGYYVDRGVEVGWGPFLLANGGQVFDKQGKRPAVNTAQTRETLEYFVDLQVKQRVSPAPDEIKQESAVNRFVNGRLAMLPQGSWQIKTLNVSAKTVNWDLVPVPLAPQTKKNGSTNQMSSIAMARQAKDKNAVWQWQRFIASKDGQETIARFQFFPARVETAEQIYYKPELGPAHRPLLRDVLKVTQAYPWLDVGGNSSGWGPIVNPLIAQILDGQLSVKDGLQQMNDQLNAAIDRGFK
jgi:multiple sugar transport system substrate-binding protein